MSSTYSKLLYHVVFSTKERHPWIVDDVLPDLHAYLGGIIKHLDGFPLMIGGIADHVHLVISLPPRIAIADAVRTIKSNSSKWLHESRKLMQFQWQAGYSAFTVSESARPAVMNYVRDQAEHHRRQDFPAELLALLRRHGIEFDERYLWD
jgi:REP element-mobilizing transposase RayT